MKTLLQINVVCNSRSTGRIAEQIGLLARENGWRSCIATGGRYSRASQLEKIEIGGWWNERCHAVESRLLDNHGLASRRATRRLVERIEELNPTVIHMHNIHGYYLNYKILFEYLNITNIPIVWTLHDCWSFTGHCAYFDSVNCGRWKTKCHDCPLKKDYPRSLFLDRSQRNYELKKRLFGENKNLHLVPVSQWLAGLVKESFLKNADIQVINNGVDLSVFTPRERKDDGKFRILGVATSWDARKGLKDFYQLREHLDPLRYEITLVGLKPEQIQELPEGIQGIERTGSVDELAGYYSKTDVLLNPTYADTFPTVNLEALACGTPVVTYRTGGSPETLTPETGLIVETGDIPGLVQAIESIRAKGKSFYTQACRKRAKEFYNKDERFMDYISLYGSLLKS